MKWLIRGFAILAAVLVIAFLFLRTPDTDVEEMRAKYGAPPSQFVELTNGQTVHLRDEGPRDAMPIILLHGSSSDLHTWQGWADALKDDYRVIRYDQIGHGLTGPAVGGTYALDDFLRDVDAVANHLQLEKFVLGGNSMGGWISAGYAREYPDRLLGLALIDASGSPVKRSSDGGGNIGFTIAGTPVLNQLMKHITPRSLVERSYRQSVSNEAVVTTESVDRYWSMLRYPGNREATIARFNTPRVVYSEADFASFDAPTLLMWGEEDRLVPFAAAKWYQEAIPNTQLVSYPGIGHLPMEEHADQSAKDLRAWLESLRPSKEE